MTSRTLSRLFTILTLATALSSSAAANEEVYAAAVQSTVFVLQSEAFGSGVLIDRERRLIVTNQHVVGADEKVMVFFPVVLQGQMECDRDFYLRNTDKYGIEGRVLAVDTLRDLAIVELASLPETAKPVGFGKPARPGQIVHHIGNPGSSDALWIYTAGYVRANYYKRLASNRMQVVETSSPVNPGDSGGPILDDSGKLVGLTQSYMIEGRLVSNGVDISEIAWFLNKVTGNTLSAADAGLPEADQGTSSPNASQTGDNQSGLRAIFGENAIARADLQR